MDLCLWFMVVWFNGYVAAVSLFWFRCGVVVYPTLNPWHLCLHSCRDTDLSPNKSTVNPEVCRAKLAVLILQHGTIAEFR
jgi:hypothetical protein